MYLLFHSFMFVLSTTDISTTQDDADYSTVLMSFVLFLPVAADLMPVVVLHCCLNVAVCSINIHEGTGVGQQV